MVRSAVGRIAVNVASCCVVTDRLIMGLRYNTVTPDHLCCTLSVRIPVIRAMSITITLGRHAVGVSGD